MKQVSSKEFLAMYTNDCRKKISLDILQGSKTTYQELFKNVQHLWIINESASILGRFF